ncbi:MAG: trigger factor family protein, partial [Planctomycetota bacterium]
MTEAAETEDKKLTSRVESEEIGPCKIKLRIEVGADRVKELIDEKYRELNESLALPGFRKGHAPRPLLERKFGKALLDDLKMEL